MGRMTRHQATPQRSEPAVTAAPAYRGGLVARRRAGAVGIPRPRLRHRRRAGPASRSAGWADSDCDITCNGADLLFRPGGRSRPLGSHGIARYRILTEPRDIGGGGAGRGSAPNGHRSERDVTGVICLCPHYYTAPVRTLHKGRMPCGGGFCRLHNGDVGYKI